MRGKTRKAYGAGVKKIWIFLASLAAASAAHAFYEDLALADGTVQTNVFVTRVEPDGLSFMHAEGVAKFYFHELSEGIQRKYNYDPAIAAVYWYYTQQAQQEWNDRQTEAARHESEERQKRLDEIEKEDAMLRSKSAAKTTNLKLLQMQEDGSWLCRPFQFQKGGFTLGRAKYTKVFDDSHVLVEGLPPTVVDNDEWRGKIYETGIQQLKSDNGAIRTLRKYKAVP